MAITIIQKQKRKKIIIWIGLIIIIVALIGIFYFVFSRSASPTDKKSEVVSPLSEELKKLEIKWKFLEDERFQNLESPADTSSLSVQESGRTNPFESF